MEAEHAPLVSVIIAAYNRPEYVNQAIASVLGQTFTDYEIIVVDDCSPDEVVQQYQLPDCARLIRLNKRHGRAGPGRNVGIRAARGRYIAFLDQDDVWLPDKLEAQVNALEKHPECGLAYCHFMAVDDSLNPSPRMSNPRLVTRRPLKQIIRRCFIRTPSCVMAPRKVLLECGLFDDSLECCTDWDMWIRIAREYPFYADPERRVLYRKHEGQLSHIKGPVRAANIKILEKNLVWAKVERPRMVSFVRSRLARSFRELALFHLVRGHDRSEVNSALIRAWQTCPWSPATYWFALKVFARNSRERVLRSDGQRS